MNAMTASPSWRKSLPCTQVATIKGYLEQVESIMSRNQEQIGETPEMGRDAARDA